jgi:formate dehydrogenase subunit delta
MWLACLSCEPNRAEKMTTTSHHLGDMANDIGMFFVSQPDRQAAIVAVANHIKSYWTPRMVAKLTAQVAHGEVTLDDLPREALRYLIEHPTAKPYQPAGGDAG